jgi:hypothetical protein
LKVLCKLINSSVEIPNTKFNRNPLSSLEDGPYVLTGRQTSVTRLLTQFVHEVYDVIISGGWCEPIYLLEIPYLLFEMFLVTGINRTLFLECPVTLC